MEKKFPRRNKRYGGNISQVMFLAKLCKKVLEHVATLFEKSGEKVLHFNPTSNKFLVLD